MNHFKRIKNNLQLRLNHKFPRTPHVLRMVIGGTDQAGGLDPGVNGAGKAGPRQHERPVIGAKLTHTLIRPPGHQLPVDIVNPGMARFTAPIIVQDHFQKRSLPHGWLVHVIPEAVHPLGDEPLV